MDTKDTKNEILNIIKEKNLSEEKLNELIIILKAASKDEKKQKEWINTVGENQDNEIPGEEFKCAWKVRCSEGYFYFASNFGRIVLAKDDSDLKNKIFIKIENGYLKNTNDLPCRIAEHTDVYCFIAEAFNEDEELKTSEYYVKNNYPQDNPDNRLELHHINNNPSDNRLINLVYLPKFIHAQAHKYS